MSTHSAKEKEHILPVKTYLAVAAALLVLTVMTVGISFIKLGGWNAVAREYRHGILESAGKAVVEGYCDGVSGQFGRAVQAPEKAVQTDRLAGLGDPGHLL